METKNKRNIMELIQLYITYNNINQWQKTSHKDLSKDLYVFHLVVLERKHLIDENFNIFNDGNLL